MSPDTWLLVQTLGLDSTSRSRLQVQIPGLGTRSKLQIQALGAEFTFQVQTPGDLGPDSRQQTPGDLGPDSQTPDSRLQVWTPDSMSELQVQTQGLDSVRDLVISNWEKFVFVKC